MVNKGKRRDEPFRFWAKCPTCCKSGRNGQPVPDYFSKAYTGPQWKQNPQCENCNTPMQFLYEVTYEDE